MTGEKRLYPTAKEEQRYRELKKKHGLKDEAPAPPRPIQERREEKRADNK